MVTAYPGFKVNLSHQYFEIKKKYSWGFFSSFEKVCAIGSFRWSTYHTYKLFINNIYYNKIFLQNNHYSSI